MNTNGTGPVFIRLPRGGDLAGRIEIGKADHAIQLEVSVGPGCDGAVLTADRWTRQYFLLHQGTVYLDRHTSTL
jgi:hypothetical protein